jgi:xylulokinase
MKPVLIGIDLGTTGCRSAVFDASLNILGEEYTEYPLIKLSDRQIEQDAGQWWGLAKNVVKASIKSSGISPERIKGISVSSQGIAVVPVDRGCNPLRNAISWLDTRAVDETRAILGKFDRFHVYRTTGKRINEAYTLPKIMWIKNNELEVYNHTYKFLMPHDFIIAKLCGAFITDHTMASGILAYDIENQKWWGEILETMGIGIEKLPEIMYSGTPAGTVRCGG